MPIEVPASITELKDLIALKLDLSQEIVIDEYESPLTETFNVIVLSGQPEGTANQNIATAYGNKLDNLLANGGSYYFARVRRLDVDTKQKPDPFLAKTHRQFKRLVNLHPLGVALASTTTQRPIQGDIYQARYMNKQRRGLMLVKKVGKSQEYGALRVSGKAADWLQKLMDSSAAQTQTQFLGDYAPGPGQGTGGIHPWPAPLQRVYVGGHQAYRGKIVENGRFPEGLLGKTNDGTKILIDLVAPWNQLENAYEVDFGFRLGWAGGIRSYKTQIATKISCTKRGRAHFAATPGQSKHGWGCAIDIRTKTKEGKRVRGYNGFFTATYTWMTENAPRFGFHNPPWARKGASGPDEPWHWEPIDHKKYIKKSSEIKTGDF